MSLRESLQASAFGPIPEPPPAEEIATVKGFNLDDQDETNWCWAAVGLSVARLLKKLVFPDQCQLVLKTLELFQCAGDCRNNVNCNSSADMVDVLGHQGIAATRHPNPENGKLTLELLKVFDEIKQQNRPVICEVPLQTGLTHFVVIVVANKTRQTVEVKDPDKKGNKPFQKVWDFEPFAKKCIEFYSLP